METTGVKLNFRKTLLLIAAIVFLFLIPITTIAILRANTKKQIWAPMISQCPDYWNLSKTENGYTKCSPNVDKSNTGSNRNINPFYTFQLPTKKTKYDYAVKNGLTWDGITNNTELISKQKIQPDRNIGQLFGNMFTLETSGYVSTTRQTQDPNYLNVWEN
jgi:ABC-type glycerol-3-phosphate transport system permease component